MYWINEKTRDHNKCQYSYSIRRRTKKGGDRDNYLIDGESISQCIRRIFLCVTYLEICRDKCNEINGSSDGYPAMTVSWKWPRRGFRMDMWKRKERPIVLVPSNMDRGILKRISKKIRRQCFVNELPFVLSIRRFFSTWDVLYDRILEYANFRQCCHKKQINNVLSNF